MRAEPRGGVINLGERKVRLDFRQKKASTSPSSPRLSVDAEPDGVALAALAESEGPSRYSSMAMRSISMPTFDADLIDV